MDINLLNQFAGLAMQGLIISPKIHVSHPITIAEEAFTLARYMVKESERQALIIHKETQSDG